MCLFISMRHLNDILLVLKSLHSRAVLLGMIKPYTSYITWKLVLGDFKLEVPILGLKGQVCVMEEAL